MTITKQFTKITSYMGNNFKELFGDMKYIPKKSKLYSKKLEKDMLDREILNEFKPTELTLGEVFNYLSEAKKENWMIFYCKDNTGVLRAVDVSWDHGGWYVFAYSVGRPFRWLAGRQAFSRNSFDTLPLNNLTRCPHCNKEIQLSK